MYNFLVAFPLDGADPWREGVYEYPLSRVAREYTEESVSERYRDLDANVLDELKSVPALFCTEGEQYPSRVGFIRSIVKKKDRVKIEFSIEQSLPSLPNGFIADSPTIFDLGRFALTRTHWAIKDGDLWSILRGKGFNVDKVASAAPSGTLLSADSSENPQVFIVHGHDDVIKYEVAAAVRELGCSPVILHEQVGASLTIIEKIERYTDVQFAVVLYTPCDIGGSRALDQLSLKPRARQNVIFEHGYLIAKLGRGKVMAFLSGNVEPPSDISGIVYTPLDSAFKWKTDLKKELVAAVLPSPVK